jgi:hypothetical protein
MKGRTHERSMTLITDWGSETRPNGADEGPSRRYRVNRRYEGCRKPQAENRVKGAKATD